MEAMASAGDNAGARAGVGEDVLVTRWGGYDAKSIFIVMTLNSQSP